MAKGNVDIKKLEQENQILRQKLANQEQMQTDMVNVLGGDIASETRKIRQKGKSSANKIAIVEQNDHKNISLWTKRGKRVGPMHPDNAIQALNKFADIGIMLSTDRPTREQIEAYEQTREGKKIIKQEQAVRARKNRSRKAGQLEKLTEAIAKMSGVPANSLNNIVKPGS